MKTPRCYRIILRLLALAIFAATTIGHAQTFSVLYNFETNAKDPSNPSSEGIIAQGRDGNLYSTAVAGGASGYGAMFKIKPGGTLTVPVSFDAAHGVPFSGLTLGTDGNFYGTTANGGTSNLGTVFKVSPSGTLIVLHNFTGGDGSSPQAPPIQGTDGNFYGTTQSGGTNTYYGTVYKITPTGTLTTLYSFDGIVGQAPFAPLAQGTDGNFYGTTQLAGKNNFGVIFRITASGKITVIYNFDGTHGGPSFSPVVQGSDGSFYGTTSSGGTKGGYGVVFKITPTGKLTVLHNINGTTDGGVPYAGLVQATDGNLYGVNFQGGKNDQGTIFRISPTKPYPYKVVYEFDGTTGAQPDVTLAQHTNGILYGDTEYGGIGNMGCCGVFYSLNIGAAPFVSLVSTSAKVGKVVEILGQGFTGTTGVSFNGTAASFKVSSDTYLTATVPNSATTGSVTVKTPGRTLTSNKTFRVTPQILSFKPPGGPVGTVVTITGVSLTQATKVAFGGVAATNFTVNSDTQVTATVPTGAKTGKIAITTPGGVPISPGAFTVTQ
jgi:uncharacterized repeat protein (TIGR03803 family)